jgi:hypothetical protein
LAAQGYGEDFEFVPVTTYQTVRRTPYQIMQNNFMKTDLSEALELVSRLSDLITRAREYKLIVEPIHSRFVGKAGQCKTQYALQVMKLLDKCGLIGVTRSAADGFFDDLVKNVKQMTTASRNKEFLYHPGVSDRELVDLDVLFLDEVNAKKVDDPGMQIIMDGVTPMVWKPMMANPAYKGRPFKPVLWISTANHEITRHEYCVPAVLRRTHHRYVIEGGRLYDQSCYKIVDAGPSFQGGFETCAGLFGRWDEQSVSTSRSQTTDADGKVTVTVNTSSSNTYNVRIKDTMYLKTFKCPHCVELSFEKFLAKTLTEVIERLESALVTHEQTSSLTDCSSDSVGEDQ